MDVIDALKRRISTRAFLDTPVSEAEVRELLEAARWSASGGNLQPWQVHVVTGEARQRGDPMPCRRSYPPTRSPTNPLSPRFTRKACGSRIAHAASRWAKTCTSCSAYPARTRARACLT